MTHKKRHLFLTITAVIAFVSNVVALQSKDLLNASSAFDVEDLEAIFPEGTLPVRGMLEAGGAGTFTISQSGVYYLTGPKSAVGVANIAITGSNVVLDLDGNTLSGGTDGINIIGTNVTVKNGTITGASHSGVLVEGTGCRIENCDVTLCTTGITLHNSSECVIEECRVRNATQAGVSLQSTWTSSVRGCEISGLHGMSSVYGVYATNGGNNSIERCVIRDVQTNSSSFGDRVGGIVIDNESANRLHDNQIGVVLSHTTTAQAYGIEVNLVSLMSSATVLPGQPATAGLRPEVAYDGEGNALAVWQHNDGTVSRIYYALYSKASGWLSAEQIPYQNLVHPASYPQVAFDCNGDALVVWIQNDGTGNHVYFSRYSKGIGWSLPAALTSSAVLTIRDLYLAVDNTGNAFALWSSGSGSVNRIAYARYALTTNTWSAADFLPGQLDYDGYSPRIGFDKDGNALAVWYQQCGGYDRIYYARYTGTWSNAAQIPNQFESHASVPVVAVDKNGNGLVVWQQEYTNNRPFIFYAHFSVKTGWTTPSLMVGVGEDGWKPEIAVNELGEVFIAWEQYDEKSLGHIAFSRGTVGGSLTSAQYIPGSSSDFPWGQKIAMDKRGRALVTWVFFNMDFNEQIYYAWYTPGLGWCRGLKVSGQLATQRSLLPQVALDEEGNAFIVWCQFDNINSHIYYASYSQKDVWVGENTVAGVSSCDNKGVGVALSGGFVINNTAYGCDISFGGISSKYITSPANARGVYNIDTNVTTPDIVPLIIDQIPTVESKLDLLTTDIIPVESKLDYLTACDYQALPASSSSIILSTDYGSYCLSADVNGEIYITGKRITLDLNDYTVKGSGGSDGIVVSGNDVVLKNGMVIGAQSGIKITGNRCRLKDITASGNVTGFELNGAQNTALHSCVACDTTREGFSLINAQKNSLVQCKAINTSGVGTVAGFKTTNGVGNRFVECKVNGVTSSDEQAYGILGYREIASEITDSTAMNIAGATYKAGIGMLGDYLSTPTVQDFSANAARLSSGIDWLNTPVGSYIATMDGGSIMNSNVVLFSPTNGFIGSVNTPAFSTQSGNNQSRWLTWQNRYFLAFSGLITGAASKASLYEFYPASHSFSGRLANFTNNDSSIAFYGIEWVISGSIPYLLYTGGYSATANINELGVLRFSGSDFTKVAGVDYPVALFNVDAHLVNGKWKVAVTGVDGTRSDRHLVDVYTFDDPQGSASLILTASYDTSTGGAVIRSGSWLDYDGEVYYAIGINNNTSTPTVRVLKYTDSPESLTLFATYNYNAAAQSVDFLVTGTTVYLAVSGDKANARVEILKFDPYESSITTRLSSYYVCSGENRLGSEIRWNRVAGVDNRVYLGVAKSGTASEPYLRVYGFDINDRSELNCVNDNVVSGIPGGDGLLVDPAVNSIYNTTAYNCQDGLQQGVRTSYSPLQPFDTSNRAVPSR